MPNLLLVGGSGFIGNLLLNNLNSDTYTITSWGRKQIYESDSLEKDVLKADIIINLAGAPIAKRWTKKYKKELLDSRILSLKRITEVLKKNNNSSKILINASAIGIYKNNTKADENSLQYEDDFMSGLVIRWEKEVLDNRNSFKSIYILRFGVVMDERGGFLKKIKLLFQFGLGAVLGKPNNFISFISSVDLVRAIDFIMQSKPKFLYFNLVAPEPLTMKTFANLYAARFKMPRLFLIPEFVFRLAMGEAADALLSGKLVYPANLLNSGFDFNHPDFTSFINSIKND